jgi:8-oxo-dGTP diphosphatase
MVETTKVSPDAKPTVWGMTVYAIIRDAQKRILLLQRSAKSRSYALHWDLPGGKIDPGENFAEALCREVREETGLNISLVALVGATQFIASSGPKVVLVFLVSSQLGEIRLSDEHANFAYVAADEVAGYPLSSHLRLLPEWLTRPEADYDKG